MQRLCRPLRWLFVGLLLLIAGIALAFAFHAWQLKQSDFIVRAEHESAAYPCIGERMLRPPTREYPALNFHHGYKFRNIFQRADHGGPPALCTRIAEISAIQAFDLMYSDAELNRMSATLPMHPPIFHNFDAMANHLFGRTFCRLTERQRYLIALYPRSWGSSPWRRAFAEAGELEALARFDAIRTQQADAARGQPVP